MKDSPILLLNANYEPLSVCNPRRAIRLMLLGKVDEIESNGGTYRAAHSDFPLPSVLKLNYFVKMRKRDIPLTKRNIMRRDSLTCQYCGHTATVMTVDHVIPKAHGGADSWDNLTTACSSCNSRKGDRTPAQAGMTLRRRPRRPHYFSFAVSRIGEIPSLWKQYLFLD